MPLLGNDILSVAGEKFGIIKEGVPVFSLQQVEPVQSLLKEKCREFNSPLFMEGKDWHVENIHYDGEEPVFDYSGSSPDCVLTITLKSAFPVQSFNAGLALAVFENMVAPMDPQAVVKTLAKCRIPGRRERLADVPPVYFDAAHNPSALERVLEGLSPFTGEIVMILAFMMDKAVSEMMEILRGKDFPIRYLLADDPRTYIPSPGDGIENVYSSVDELVGECREDPENVLYFFTGTFRIYSMAQEFSRKIERA
jgi:dihydrofolate synthase/folylpolyglutamate synthase